MSVRIGVGVGVGVGDAANRVIATRAPRSLPQRVKPSDRFVAEA